MKKFLRKLLVYFFISSIFSFSLFSIDFFKNIAANPQKLVPAGHWVYKAMEDVFSEVAANSFATQSAPLPISELKLYFLEVDFDLLSESGKKQYYRLLAYFNSEKTIFSSSVLSLGANLKITPELYYKSNDNIDWTDRYFFKDNFLSFPVFLSISQFVFIESDFFFGRNYWSRRNPYSFTWHNFPADFKKDTFWQTAEFDWPRTAYISFGIPINDVAFFNIQFGRGAKSIGNTQTGSIIMSPEFETDAYFSLSFFSPNIKYTLDVIQSDYNHYLYSHRMEFRIFKKLHLTLLESSYINSSFELRFLNPFMFLHSFGYWGDYLPENDGNTCAFIGAAVDFIPIKNFHIYALYAQNEIRAPTESSASTQPNSMGWQAGLKYNIPTSHGTWRMGIEGLYTLPWLYLKYTPDSSLVRIKRQINSLSIFPVTSWMGTPFGPDSIAVAFKTEFEEPGKWAASFCYQFIAQGSNAFADFLLDESGEKRSDEYYPSALPDKKEGARKANWPAAFHGIAQITNRFTVEGSYIFTSHFSAAAKLSYAFILNNRNILNNTQQGVELAFSGTFKLFD